MRELQCVGVAVWASFGAGVAVWVGCSMGELGSEVGAVWWLPCSSWAVGRLQCGEDAV